MVKKDQQPRRIAIVRRMGTPDAKRWETTGKRISETEVWLAPAADVQPGDVIYLKADSPLSVTRVQRAHSGVDGDVSVASVEPRAPKHRGGR